MDSVSLIRFMTVRNRLIQRFPARFWYRRSSSASSFQDSQKTLLKVKAQPFVFGLNIDFVLIETAERSLDRSC